MLFVELRCIVKTPTNHMETLAKPEVMKETGSANQYVLIKYLADDGRVKCGWIYSGKEPNPWSFVKPKAGHEGRIKSYTGTESCIN